MEYKACIMLDGEEFVVLTDDGSNFTEKEAMNFCEVYSKSEAIYYINTDKGILSIPNLQNKNVYFICKPI